MQVASNYMQKLHGQPLQRRVSGRETGRHFAMTWQLGARELQKDAAETKNKA